ncbi:MAG: hypothetical protein HDT21_05485 [Ruminococcus sp.]|nr:hypothetical protein [Ruminococcus sp.]
MFAPPRNAFAFLTSCSVLGRYAPAGAGRDFALLLKLTFGQLRPKGSALWTSASWAQLDQLLSAASPPERFVRRAYDQLISTP